ncbi:hypothetical protein C8Q73DRAFT_88357 [Cubamyces lactineus]|nr:hypothetical protein C8Q73DRAFT_88357 [Cubamyces lactineus]
MREKVVSHAARTHMHASLPRWVNRGRYWVGARAVLGLVRPCSGSRHQASGTAARIARTTHQDAPPAFVGGRRPNCALDTTHQWLRRGEWCWGFGLNSDGRADRDREGVMAGVQCSTLDARVVLADARRRTAMAMHWHRHSALPLPVQRQPPIHWSPKPSQRATNVNASNFERTSGDRLSGAPLMRKPGMAWKSSVKLTRHSARTPETRAKIHEAAGEALVETRMLRGLMHHQACRDSGPACVSLAWTSEMQLDVALARVRQ